MKRGLLNVTYRYYPAFVPDRIAFDGVMLPRSEAKDPPINYCRIYPCLLVRQVDQFDRLKLPFIYSVWPLASLPGKSQSLLG